jgi:hypothetical protein
MLPGRSSADNQGMKTVWRIVEIGAYVAFCLDIMLIWVGMLGDYHRITYDVPGSLGLPICAIVAGIANRKRGGSPSYF